MTVFNMEMSPCGKENERMSCRNIGIFAHVDAGKTTLSEQLLVYSGTIREAGSVDRGTAHTDSLPVERRRGISVKATCVFLKLLLLRRPAARGGLSATYSRCGER